LPDAPQIAALAWDIIGQRIALNIRLAVFEQFCEKVRRIFAVQTVAIGTTPTCRDVRISVAIGWKADIARTSSNGRE
jgi:hypothetical protein